MPLEGDAYSPRGAGIGSAAILWLAPKILLALGLPVPPLVAGAGAP